MRILLVEDEYDLAQSTRKFLSENGYDIDIADNLRVAWESVQSIEYPLVLLDRRLPDGDGLSLIVKSQKLNPMPRFLVLSALGDLDDKVAGLDIGAHEYVVKPCAPKELLARVRVMLRLPRAVNMGRVEVGALHFDLASRVFHVRGKAVELRRYEYLILELLVTNAKKIVRRSKILDRLYGFDEVPASNTLDSHVSRLRTRLRDLQSGVKIQTARGLGYLLREEE